MANILNQVTKWALKSIPLVIGLVLFGNTSIVGWLPVIVHQILGIILIVAGVMALAKR